jgi:adenylate kinase
MKVIIVTGSVGTGKTTLSRKLAKKLNLEYIDVSKLIDTEHISSGYDKKRKCKIIDIKKLNKLLIKLINKCKKLIIKKTKGIVIDSHFSHYLPKRYVDLCIVVKCDLKVIEKRLKKRKYNKDKIKENIECEIFDVCLDEAKRKKHKIVVINTTKGINISEISKKVKAREIKKISGASS